MKRKCPECGRVFDLTDETDAEEMAYGHDCDPSLVDDQGRLMIPAATAATIATTLLNGNISDAREWIIAHDPHVHQGVISGLRTLDVLGELREQMLAGDLNSGTVDVYDDAHERLRRCLEGGA